jgi:hypothetical protein
MAIISIKMPAQKQKSPAIGQGFRFSNDEKSALPELSRDNNDPGNGEDQLHWHVFYRENRAGQ